jgi:hypothetical protein
MEWNYENIRSSDKKAMKVLVSKALKTWLTPLQKRNPKVTNTIRFSCPGHIKITLSPNFTGENHHLEAQCFMGAYPHIEIRKYNYKYLQLMVHEFGHGFGLLDTYYYRTSGRCKPGQPLSVMCTNYMTELRRDDVAGINAMYDLVYPVGSTPITGGSELEHGLIVKGLSSDGKLCGRAASNCFCSNGQRLGPTGSVLNSCILFKNNKIIEFGPSKESCTPTECKRRSAKAIKKYCGNQVLTDKVCE